MADSENLLPPHIIGRKKNRCYKTLQNRSLRKKVGKKFGDSDIIRIFATEGNKNDGKKVTRGLT